ncbi:MAG: hypothetical protein IT384_12060 [Deltaproteobacteria bacterium]|nr:hypothetical protein [Deltaproteobacteria bacterium]
MAKIDTSSEPLTPFLRRQQGLSNEGAHLETITEGIRDHVAFFVDVVESRKQGKAVVTVASTGEGLRLLGCDASFTAAIGLPRVARGSQKNEDFGGLTLTGVFAQRQGNGFGGPVEVDALGPVGIRGESDGIRADSGSFRKEDGTVDPDKAAEFFLRVGGNKPYVTLDDLKAYFAEGSYPGKLLNELEFRLAFDLFAQDGKLTAAHWVAFLDGTAWEGLAQARLDGKLYQPVGEPKHDSAKKIAQILAQQTGALGGVYADAGTSALYAAAGIFDTEETRERQQAMKNLGPTLGGAIALLCPFKGMMAGMKAQEASPA